MDIIGNVLLPIAGGVIGSTATIFWTEINSNSTLPWSVKLKYIWLGAISGFVAVNLFNPGGSFSQITPLSVFAGLSPISFLKKQAMTDGRVEDDAFFTIHGQAGKIQRFI